MDELVGPSFGGTVMIVQMRKWNRMSKIGFAIFASLALHQTAAVADIEVTMGSDITLKAIQAALGAREISINEVSGSEIREASQQTLNTVVKQGLMALRSEGYAQTARNYESEWNRNFSEFFVSPSFFDLGDHRPLSAWLARFYTMLEGRLGSNVIHQGLLGDVYDMNYAIPIVFTPMGQWRTNSMKRDSIEYRKHFIPFTNIVTYWSAYLACNRVMANYNVGKSGSKICKTVAGKLRFAMGRYVAPKISDFTFAKINGMSTRLNITSADLVYTNAGQLAQELKMEGVR